MTHNQFASFSQIIELCEHDRSYTKQAALAQFPGKSHVQALCAFVQVPPRNCAGISISPSYFNFDCSRKNKTEIRYRRSVGRPVRTKQGSKSSPRNETSSNWMMYLTLSVPRVSKSIITKKKYHKLFHWNFNSKLWNYGKPGFLMAFIQNSLPIAWNPWRICIGRFIVWMPLSNNIVILHALWKDKVEKVLRTINGERLT